MSSHLLSIQAALMMFLAGSAAALQGQAPAAKTPAFPGAEGAGKWSAGGRGGKVLAVTNLHDSGPGSLRAAVEVREPRTVVFRVSGTIELKTPLRVQHPFITIAGQTAPGGGICLKNYELQIGGTHDVIVRHLRCRPGDKTSQAAEMDALTMWDVKDVMIDHCSATWSTDECLSVTRDSDRVTVQNCLIGEALTVHSYGSIIASYHGAISFLNNLYTSNRSRNPRPGGYQSLREPGRDKDPGPRIDFCGNVIFNWGDASGYTGSGKAEEPERIAMNYVGNYLKPGLDTRAACRGQAFMLHKGASAELYVEGNEIETGGRPLTAPTDIVKISPGCTLVLRDKPLDLERMAALPKAGENYARVLEKAGATRPVRDAVDERIIAGVRDGSGRHLPVLAAEAWPQLHSTEAPPDQDDDGLPDAWEQAHGLNERDPTDAGRPAGPEGWTNLEVWMNQL